MYIGLLNDKYSSIDVTYFKKNLKKIPTPLLDGNPFLKEPLHFHWEELTSNGLDLLVTLSHSYLINQIVVYFGERSTCHGITLYDYDKNKKFDSYYAETGASITKRSVALSLEGPCDHFLLEFDADFSMLFIDKIEIYGAIFEGEKVFPVPSQITIENGSVFLDKLDGVAFDSEFGRNAATILIDKLKERSVSMRVCDDGFVRLRLDPSCEKNGYRLLVSEDEILLTSGDQKGMVQGVETLLKLIDCDQIPCCEVNDAPFCEFRGVHLFLPAEEEMDFAKKLIRDLLSPMGYNFIILQFTGAMVLESHPEINEAFLNVIEKSRSGEWPAFPHPEVGGGKLVSKESVRDFVAYARSFGIEIVPEIQSLGHVQYMTLAHPEIAEIPYESENESKTDEMVEDTRPKMFYHHSACPSNPKTYELLFDILDEIIEVVRPTEYVHMGHDEVYELGVCAVCKEKSEVDLLAYDINKIYDHLKEKGLKMMIWADMLQSYGKRMAYPAIDLIPKDILLLDFIWYFHRNVDIEEALLSHDFEILFGNMYSSHFPRYENRIRKEGVRGGQISAWTKTAEHELGREGKLYDFLYGGQMMWSENYSSHNRFAYDKIISDMIPHLRETFQNQIYPSREKGAKQISLKKSKLLQLKESADGSEFAIGKTLRSLIFEHATSDYLRRIPWIECETIAEYVVTYEDNSTLTIPLAYGENICHWDRRQNEPFAANYYRHNGYSGTWFTDSYRVKTVSGKEGTVYRYEWINAFPDKEIESIRLVKKEDVDTGVILHQIFGIQ